MNDLAIAREAELRHIRDVAGEHGILPEELRLYGEHKAKVELSCLGRLAGRPQGKYVLVTAITPTPLGEGKTVTTVGLSLGLNKIGKRAVCTIRQPSMGPVFGIKGGAAGGGRSQVVPMEDFNLHLTGDFHAVAAAHNLCAAFTDTSLLLDNPLDLDPGRIQVRRVVDVNDRALREIEIGLGGEKNGVPRRTGFDITAASEVMVILALCDDLADLRARLGRIVVGQTYRGADVTAEDLEVAGSMAVLMKDAVLPNIMQTLEGTLAFVHAGPFANIAHGNSSVLADRIGLAVADYVVTEAGFGADMGAEKFFNIKCRASGLAPDAAVLVATVRGLKAHSGKYRIVAGKPLPDGLHVEDLGSLEAGLPNLEKQCETLRMHGVPVVVALNRFPTDSPREIELVLERAKACGAREAAVSDAHARGGEGTTDLAEAVVRAAESGESELRFLYELGDPLEAKIEALAYRVYGAGGVTYTTGARAKLEDFEERGYGRFPVCMAKTQYSLSHDPKFKGRPMGYEFPIRDLRVAAGAGFVYPLAGKIMTMPGLGRNPAGKRIDLDADGLVQGLF